MRKKKSVLFIKHYIILLGYKAMTCDNTAPQLELDKTNDSWYQLPLLKGDTKDL
jgi:hypothetical protein